MVRTRGLGWALDKVIGRTLGREVSRDSNEAPHWRRPTASAHRQQEAAPVGKDVQHVDDAADEVHEQPEELVADVVTDAKGFLDAP